MALANFFDKTALGAAQLLQGIDYESFKSIIEAHHVGIFFDGAAASSPEGRHTVDLAIDVLARLYPKLAVLYDGDSAWAFAEELAESAAGSTPTSKSPATSRSRPSFSPWVRRVVRARPGRVRWV